jgi:hypothetical protein
MRALLILAALLGGPALAQTACVTEKDAACIRWVAPTQNEDNSPIVGTITYEVYRVTSPGAGEILVTTFATSTRLSLQRGGRQCYFVIARTSLGPSAPSNIACKTMRMRAPTNGSIEERR